MVRPQRTQDDGLTSSNQKGAISGTVCGWHVWILLRIPVARILCDFDFLRGLAAAVWMDFRLEGTRRNVNLLTFMLRSLKAERCDLGGGGLGGLIAPALEPFQNKDSSLVLLL